MTDVTAERVARNDATFREANDRIAEKATEYGIDGQIPFICECAQESCTTILRLTLDEYAEVRGHPTHFVNERGHAVAAQGYAREIDDRGRYVIVEKLGEAAELVRDLDARTP